MKQEEWGCERTRQYDTHLDAKLTVITKRHHVGTVPKDIEQMRKKYAVLSNSWLFSHTSGNHAAQCLEYTSGQQDLQHGESHARLFGTPASFTGHIAPTMKCGVRTEADELTRPRGMGIKEALWTFVKDNEHRTEHGVQSVAMANSSSAKNFEMEATRGRIQRLAQGGTALRSPHAEFPQSRFRVNNLSEQFLLCLKHHLKLLMFNKDFQLAQQATPCCSPTTSAGSLIRAKFPRNLH